MSYALVHFPTIDTRQIDELRRKYDPQVDLIAPHITIPYVPHVTLGAFADDAASCSDALRDSKRLRLRYQCVVDRLHLVKVNDDGSRITREEEFLLKM
jgi:2'-5' RNA ligase